jgi:teichuronic acid biosynthesis glycosyltransferase TuaG
VPEEQNFGLKFVDGNLLTFIDADDEWNPNFLEIMVQKVLKPNSMAFGGYKRKYPNSENIFIPTKKISFTDLFRGSDISCLTAIYHFANNSEIPKFGEIRARNDLIFNLRVLQVIDYAEPVSEVLATYHIQKRSISRNKFKLIYWQYYVSRSFQRPIILSIKDVIHWAFYGLKKYQIFNFFRKK